MRITRHFVRVGGCLVHYRRTGSGPALLMVHQSPRSSAEYEPLMREWGAYFTIIAPDTPGFGQSDPLPDLPAPEIDEFAAALLALLDALGLPMVGAYGFHSGAVILLAAAKLQPHRFTAIAANGYAVWLPEERAAFGEAYLPPFQPMPYGEHLVWAWNRILEQSWFFPWYDVRDEARLSVAHADPRRVHETVMDLLASGDAYRHGYGAVLRAPRDVPAAGEPTPPVFLTAADNDPLQPHLARLGPLPIKWCVETAPTRAATNALCFEHLLKHPAPAPPAPVEADNFGFVHVTAEGFDGLLHWRGQRDSDTLLLHAPARSAELVARPDALAIDLPGHGLSDDWRDAEQALLEQWTKIVRGALTALGVAPMHIEGEGWSAALAALLGGPIPLRLDVDAGKSLLAAIPSTRPDRYGNYLTAAWVWLRAGHFFQPPHQIDAAHAVPFAPADLDPLRLQREHLAFLQSRHARALLAATLRQLESPPGAARAG